MARKRQKGIKKLSEQTIRFDESPEDRELMEAAFNQHSPRWGDQAKDEEKVHKNQSLERLKCDLHGLTLEEACRAVDSFLGLQRAISKKTSNIRFVTGKGRNSGPRGAILPEGVFDWLKEKWGTRILSISARPQKINETGLYDKGWIDIKFRS